jgi:hypothetical protein
MAWQDSMSAALGKLSAAARENHESIERGIDKMTRVADEKTGSQYSDHIRKGADGLRAGLKKVTEAGGPDNRPH